MDSFVWNPPPASDPASPKIQRMRRQYGCAAVGMSRFGPDMIDLKDVECFRVQVDDSGHECGIEVYNEMRGSLLWALSGAVVFCGPSYIGHGQVVCSSIDEVESLDVSVGFEEAMPLATTTTTTVVNALFQNFAFLTAYFIIMGHFEAIADSEHWPWWRLFWVLGPGLSIGALVYPRYWGMTLFGHHSPVWFCGMGAAVLITCMGSLLLPTGWAVDFGSTAVNNMTCSVFTVSSVAMIIYIGICVCVHLLLRRVSGKGLVVDWQRHSAWTCVHILTTLGTCILLYGIALAYVCMQVSFPQTAALFLAITTSVTEKIVSRIVNFSYTTLIYMPRSSVNGSKTIIGDQRRYLTVPVAMTHACCQAVRFVSLLSVTVRSPSWAWLPCVLLNVSVNLMERTQVLLSLLVRILPWRDWMCPGLSLIILFDVKLHAGYAQYISVLGLLVAEMVSGGFKLTSVLNMQCVILICCCILLKILEDVLVHVLPRSDHWRRHLSPYYEQQPVLHPKQMLLIDNQGVKYEAAPLSLHGQRSLALVEVMALMWPSSLFTYVLMTLLLGAGYIHGVCDVPIPKEIQVLDALIWETPLRCV
ncbi:hda-6 [Symbiodinium sp. KB8]|nr:hda-6 [Symbiodinium sp. KB8]